jgi:hypothetical protein
MHSSSHSPQPAWKELELQSEIRSCQDLAFKVSCRDFKDNRTQMLHTGTLEDLLRDHVRE